MREVDGCGAPTSEPPRPSHRQWASDEGGSARAHAEADGDANSVSPSRVNRGWDGVGWRGQQGVGRCRAPVKVRHGRRRKAPPPLTRGRLKYSKVNRTHGLWGGM